MTNDKLKVINKLKYLKKKDMWKYHLEFYYSLPSLQGGSFSHVWKEDKLITANKVPNELSSKCLVNDKQLGHRQWFY